VKNSTSEQNHPAGPRPAGPLGPVPGVGTSPLSAARATVLDRLRAQPRPVTQATLAGLTGLHPNTVRGHLDGLVRRGAVRRFKAVAAGRGRPAWLYEATPRTTTGDYAGLAETLARSLERTSEAPWEDAAVAGAGWGHDLVRTRAAGGGGTTPEQAREVVVGLLADLGFEPRRDSAAPGTVRLTRCPLLGAATRHPQVVCGVHLGVVRGALEELGADPAGSDLVPFAEPGACRLLVPPLPRP
jgi:predicted ArsR family transcriptional regulator